MLRCPTCGDRFADAQFCPLDGTRLVVTRRHTDRTGEVLGDRYRLIERVGTGGMSEVYRAEHVHLNKGVAVKLLRPHISADEEAVERLHREAVSTSDIGHPNIVQIRDFGHSEDGAVYLVMEWLEGETLEQRMARESIDPVEGVDLVAQACDGLAAAHAQGVIHRDVKPANLFLAREAGGGIRLKVLDFGIAKLATSDSHLTRTGTFVGTPYYMSPEQALGRAIDGRTDVYSVGVILYELVTGTVPFDGESFIAILHQHATREPEPPSARAPGRAIPSAVEALVLRCMAKAPDDRPGSMPELARAMRSVVADPERAPARASGPVGDRGAGDSLELPVRHGPRIAFALLLLVLVGGGVAGALVLSGGDAGGRADAAIAAPGDGGTAAPLTADAGVDTVWQHSARGDGFAYSVAVSPSAPDVGESVGLRIEIDEADGRLAGAIEAGRAEATVSLMHYQHHRKTYESVLPVREGVVTAVVVPPREGKYHVALALGVRGRRLAADRFDICVGAEPGTPRAADLCPGLNADDHGH